MHYGDIHTSQKTFIDVNAEYENIPKLDIQFKKISPASRLEDGDVVFVDASEDDDGASKHLVVINKMGVPFISGLHTIVAKDKANVLNEFFKRYCFKTHSMKRQFYFYSVGTKVTGISKRNIEKLTLQIPSCDEQEAIASILCDLDSEISALESKLTKARQIKQGMMHNLLTGRIRLV